ncbi:MAG TPA: dodecin domain-containing protein [Acidimicrobiales bacterium]|nr:dodecin domain-containing protein [Acidimicrobiales bacterium]
MTSFLVVANKTLGGEGLAAHLRQVIKANPLSDFVVVVPFSAPVPVDAGGAMGGIAVIDLETEEYLESTARGRLDALLGWLRAAGVQAEGEVVRGDPVASMERVARSHTFDEIIISTLPERISQWLRMDLVRRVSRKFAMPITAVIGTANDELLPPAEQLVNSHSPDATAMSTSSNGRRVVMTESVYKIIELVGTSTESWEKAAAAAVTKASKTLRDLRVAEIAQLDLVIDNGVISAYRAKVKVSFKYEGE